MTFNHGPTEGIHKPAHLGQKTQNITQGAPCGSKAKRIALRFYGEFGSDDHRSGDRRVRFPGPVPTVWQARVWLHCTGKPAHQRQVHAILAANQAYGPI